MQPEANFCPSCGKKMSEHEAPKRSIKWFKILLGTLFLGLLTVILTLLFSEDITNTVSEQLKAIKEGRLTEAYYNFTAKAFQEATSLESFREFTSRHPAFSKNRSVRFVDREIDDRMGTLKAMLLTEKEIEIPIQYKLIKERDQWRILSIKLEDAPQNTSVFDSEPLVQTIQNQMEKIRQRHWTQAYEDYTSKAFRQATSYQEFETFVREQPGFSDNESLQINDLSFNNNTVTFKGISHSRNGSTYPVEYALIQEDGAWKILHIEIVKPKQVQANAPSPMKISKFVLGNSVDPKGFIFLPQELFKSQSGDIYLNLYLKEAAAGTRIELVFEHLSSGSSIEPVTTHVSENGDTILTFVFSPPKTGWPLGNYRLHATSSTGIKGSFDFKVNE